MSELTRSLAPKPDQIRFRPIVEAAAHAFALAGYHRTQMADIARRAGVALGTLYRYAASKEDLFVYALALGVGQDPRDVTADTPVRDVEAYFAKHISDWFDPKEIADALMRPEEPAPLRTAFEALFNSILTRRLTLRIVDRSAHDLPELANVYSQQVREPVMRLLVSYLETQQARGGVRQLANTEASARLVIEVCAWFAMHREFSPGGVQISDPVARETALTHLTLSFRSHP